MKIIFLLMIFVLLVSCNKKSDGKNLEYQTIEQINSRIKEGKAFFDFDEVIHYEIAISEDEYYDLVQKDTISKETKLLSLLLEDSCPTNRKERQAFDDAMNLPIVNSKNIHPKFHEELRKQIFVEKKCKNIETTACAALYRDIYIFKKNKIETGIAKICFACGLYSFSKGDFISDCFGMNKEFGKLKIITSENKNLK